MHPFVDGHGPEPVSLRVEAVLPPPGSKPGLHALICREKIGKCCVDHLRHAAYSSAVNLESGAVASAANGPSTTTAGRSTTRAHVSPSPRKENVRKNTKNACEAQTQVTAPNSNELGGLSLQV